jgi:hypothetical protein
MIDERLITEVLSHNGRFGVRYRTDPHRAVRIVQDEIPLARGAFASDFPADVQAPLPQHPGRELEPARAVMVAGDHDDRHSNIENEPRKNVVEECHRIGRRKGAIVDIARHENRGGLRIARQLDELIEHVRLILGEVDPVEEAP